jgi:hypothetical protein
VGSTTFSLSKGTTIDLLHLGVISHAEKLCGSFWWRDIFTLVDDFHDVSFVRPRNGQSIFFWLDKWMFNGRSDPLSTKFPRLFSYVIQLRMSAAQFYNIEDKRSLFYLPLCEQAHDEFL